MPFQKWNKINIWNKHCLWKKWTNDQKKKHSERMTWVWLWRVTTDIVKEKIRNSLLWRDITWWDKIGELNKISNNTIEYKKKARERNLWENNPNWKWWLTNIRDKIEWHFKYRQWRSDIFTRDDFTCQKCGIRWWIINAHHIKYLNIIIKENNIETLEDIDKCEELWNINNWITLCYECHKKIHFPRTPWTPYGFLKRKCSTVSTRSNC